MIGPTPNPQSLSHAEMAMMINGRKKALAGVLMRCKMREQSGNYDTYDYVVFDLAVALTGEAISARAKPL